MCMLIYIFTLLALYTGIKRRPSDIYTHTHVRMHVQNNSSKTLKLFICNFVGLLHIEMEYCACIARRRVVSDCGRIC